MDHDDDLAALVELARVVVATDAANLDDALQLADGVLTLHDQLSKGDIPLPGDWMPTVRKVVMAEMHREQQAARDAGLLMHWMLQQTPHGVITIPEEELVTSNQIVLERWKNPVTNEHVFRIVHEYDRPNLTLIKES